MTGALRKKQSMAVQYLTPDLDAAATLDVAYYSDAELLAWFHAHEGRQGCFACGGGHWWAVRVPTMIEWFSDSLAHPMRHLMFTCPNRDTRHLGYSTKAVPDLTGAVEAAYLLAGPRISGVTRPVVWTKRTANRWRRLLLQARATRTWPT